MEGFLTWGWWDGGLAAQHSPGYRHALLLAAGELGALGPHLTQGHPSLLLDPQLTLVSYP